MSENFKSFDDMKLYLENVSSKKSNPVKLKKKRQIPSSKQKANR